jgi:putative heme-binding domain-containing protein
MRAKNCPWGPLAVVFAATGAASASLVGERWLTLTLAILGLCALSLCLSRRRTATDYAWLGLGAVTSGAVACLTLLAPGGLNRFWDMDGAVINADPNQLVKVPADRPFDTGAFLGDAKRADAVTEGIRQNDLFIRVKSVKADKMPTKQATARLLVHIALYQVRPGRTIEFLGFGKARHTPALTDEKGRRYAFVGQYPHRFSAAFDLDTLHLDHVLVFELPADSTEKLTLAVPASAWGQTGTCRFHVTSIEREPPPNLAVQLARYKKLLRGPAATPPDAALGRAVFAKNCQECHTLFGVGGKTGPDLTQQPRRKELDFLLTSIVDPSAEFAKGFEPWVVTTVSGRIINGIIKEKTADAITLQVVGQKVVVPREEIDEMEPSKVSLMPADLLKLLGDDEVRALFTYLSGEAQTAMLARPETLVHFAAYGQDLNLWQRERGEWSVDQGELVALSGKTDVPSRLLSEMVLADDFRLRMRFRVAKGSLGAVVLSDADKQTALTSAPRVALAVGEDFNPGADGGFHPVSADAWNRLELEVRGLRLTVRLNGKNVSVPDCVVPRRCQIVLQGGGNEVRFAQLGLHLFSAAENDAP